MVIKNVEMMFALLEQALDRTMKDSEMLKKYGEYADTKKLIKFVDKVNEVKEIFYSQKNKDKGVKPWYMKKHRR